MAGEDFEIDFLASTQLSYDPDSFARVVKEAFQFEHSCVENQDIAEVLGVDKSRVSQILNSPERLKADTISNLIEHLENDKNRYRILWAWIRECTGIDIRALPGGRFIGRTINQATLDRFSGQVKEGRHLFTAREAFKAAMAATDPSIREPLLDQAFFAQKKLATPGRAMKTARVIVEGAVERREPHRVAAGQLFRARILLDLPQVQPAEIWTVVERAARCLDGSPERPEARYITASSRNIENFRIGATLSFLERKSKHATLDSLESIQSNLQKSLKGSSLKYQDRFQRHLYSARAYLLEGKTFQAEEHLDKAHAIARRKNLDATELCAPIQARILEVTETPEQVVQFLESASSAAIDSFDLEFRRTIEWELARVENNSFPDS